MTHPLRDPATGQFISVPLNPVERKTVEEYYAPVHPADAISAEPQKARFCTTCRRPKASDAWLYCDACAWRDDAFDEAHKQAAEELGDAIRGAFIIVGLGVFVAGALAIGWWLW